MRSNDQPQPLIIIKRSSKSKHAHHGGAWKVAYADFVTAMMAFFLLMWLLNATEAEQLQGLADYFAPTVGVQGRMGIGFRGGASVLSSGLGADKLTNRGIVFGGVPTGPIIKVIEKILPVTEEEDGEKISLLMSENVRQQNEETDSTSTSPPSEGENAIEDYLNGIAKQLNIGDNIQTIHTVEGLKVQIKSSTNEGMFKKGSAELNSNTKIILEKLGEILTHLPNYVSITGHTSSAFIRYKKGYNNWKLSSDRADAARSILTKAGVHPFRIARIIGESDNSPIDRDHPDTPVNDRITLVLLKKDVIADHKQGAPKEIFLDPTSKEARELIYGEVEEEIIEPEDDFEEYTESTTVEDFLNEENFSEEYYFESEDPFSDNDSAPELSEFFAPEDDPEPTNEQVYVIEDDNDVEYAEAKDPFGGKNSAAPKQLFVSEGISQDKTKNRAIANPFADVFDRNDEITEFTSQDPFGGKNSAAPEQLFADENIVKDKTNNRSIANPFADVFEGDEEDISEFISLDPFAGRNSAAPKQLFADESIVKDKATNKSITSPFADIFGEDKGEVIEFASRDPFSGRTSAAPKQLFVNEEVKDKTKVITRKVIKKKVITNPFADIFGDNQQEGIEFASRDPFSGRNSAAPKQLFVSEAISQDKTDNKTIANPFADIFGEDEQEGFEFVSRDPFSGKNSAAPEQLFVSEGISQDKTKNRAIASPFTDIFGEDQGEGIEFASHDPFNGRNSAAPKQLFVSEGFSQDRTKNKTITNPFADIFGEDQQEGIEFTSRDPFSGKNSAAPKQLFVNERGASKNKLVRNSYADIFEQDDDKEYSTDTKVGDPFTGRNAAAPSVLFVKEGGRIKKKKAVIPKNAYLFEEEDVEEITEQEFRRLRMSGAF